MGDRLATIDMGRKVGGGYCNPFHGGSWVHIVAWAEAAYLRTKLYPDPSNRLATIHKHTDRQDRQRSLAYERTVTYNVRPTTFKICYNSPHKFSFEGPGPSSTNLM